MKKLLGILATGALLISPAYVATGEPKSAPVQATTATTTICADDLLKEVINKPGGWDQMCSFPRVSGNDFSLYSYDRTLTERIMPENFNRLRERRPEVIKAIIYHIKSHSDQITATERYGSMKMAFDDPVYAYEHERVILIDLNGVEALPVLLDLESLFAQMQLEPNSQDSKKQMQAAVAHRLHSETLSCISAILRQERYAPLLASDYEKQFEKALKSKDEAALGAQQELSANQRLMFDMDPIYRVPRRFKNYVDIPATEENRSRFVSWAKQYLSSTPPEKRLAEKGMSPWPIRR